MKKILSFILVLMMLVLSLASCGGGADATTATTTTTTATPTTTPHIPAEQTIFDKLNDMAYYGYSSAVINISSTLGSETLTDTYTVMQLGQDTMVNYTCVRRSTFENGQIPTDYYTTYTGSIVVRDGKIVSQNGDQVDINVTALGVKGFHFEESYFADVKDEAGKFSAKVTSPQEFFGNSSLSISDVALTVEYGVAFTSLVITYTAQSGAQVVIDYILM